MASNTRFSALTEHYKRTTKFLQENLFAAQWQASNRPIGINLVIFGIAAINILKKYAEIPQQYAKAPQANKSYGIQEMFWVCKVCG